MIKPVARLSDSELLTILALTPNATAIYRTEEMVIETASDTMIALWGKDKSVIGMRMEDAVPELAGQPYTGILKEVWRSGITYEGTEAEAVLRVDGTLQTFYFDFIYRAIKDEAGNMLCILHTASNVTERVKNKRLLQGYEQQQETFEKERAMNAQLNAANEALQKTQAKLQSLVDSLEEQVTERTATILQREEKLRLAIETGKMATWSVHPATYQITMSDYIREIFGLPAGSEVQMEAIMEAVHPSYRQPLTDVLNNAIMHHQPSDIEYPVTNYKTGETKWVRATGQVFPDAEGRVSEYSGLLIDITEHVQARDILKNKYEREQKLNEELASANEELAAGNEEITATNEELNDINKILQQSQQELVVLNKQLSDNERRLRYMLAEAPVAISLLTGKELLVFSANKKMLEVWGKTTSIIGKPLHIALPELKGQPFLGLLDEVFTSAKPHYGNEVKALLEQNGVLEEVYSNFVYYPLKDEAGHTTDIVVVANIVTDLVVARHKAEQAEEMLRIAVDAAELGSYYINTEDRIFVPSPRLKEFFGFAPDDEVPYEAAISQIHPDYRQKAADLVETAITQGVRFDMEYPVIGHRDGKIRWVRGIGIVQHDRNGKGFFTGVLHEITEQKRDEIRKNDFIGMVSHELKTPLTSMSGYLQMLQMDAEKKEDGFAISFTEKANKQVSKMTTLINGFLNVSRLESGKIQIDKTQFDMAQLMKEAEEEALPLYNLHRIVFAPVEPALVQADRDKIGQVITNLINNAVKYSPANTAIQVACVTVEEMITVSVKDEGIGIQPDDQHKLFDRYYRVNNDKARSVAGFGIGLYLSAEIIQRHDGKIWVASEVGKGSIFYFSLPASES